MQKELDAKQILSGDFADFAPVIERYQQPIFRFLLGMIRNPHMARDLTQDTFLRAFLKRDQYDPAYKIESWLYRVARNLCIDNIRYESIREHETFDPIDNPQAAPSSATQHSPLVVLERKQSKQLLLDAVDQLSAPLREVILLHYLAEKSVKEIATILSLPVGTVLARLHRGRKKLKQSVQTFEEGDAT